MCVLLRPAEAVRPEGSNPSYTYSSLPCSFKASVVDKSYFVRDDQVAGSSPAASGRPEV